MVRYFVIATIGTLSAAAVMLTFRTDEIDSSANNFVEIQKLRQVISGMESDLREERAYRLELERRLEALASQNQTLANSNQSRQSIQAADESAQQDIVESSLRRDESLMPDPGVEQVQSLVQEGISEREATEIVRLSEEYEMQWLQAQYEARQSGQPANGNLRAELAQQFKENLGEENYEKYLRAVGQTTSVTIRNVLESSPAQSVGLQSGDQIVSYEGRRVYNILELNQLTQVPNDTGFVTIEFIRNGSPMAVTVPKGPIGITASVRASD